MWVLTLFDLPVMTKQQRTQYRRFHDFLLSDGFQMLQFSVYVRPCPTFEDAEKHGRRVEDKLPPEGQVRVLILTSLQYARMKCFFGEMKGPPETEPAQLSFF